jgi:AraC-like DNA-binding protein
MTTAEKVAQLQALKAELYAITTRTERRTYGDLGQNLNDLIHDLRLHAQWKVLP